MAELRDKDTGAIIGSITDEQLRFLVDQFEEESDTDRDYWFNKAAVDMLRDSGADAELLALLVTAMGDRDEMEIEWS